MTLFLKQALKNSLFQVKFLVITKKSLYENWIKNRIDHMISYIAVRDSWFDERLK